MQDGLYNFRINLSGIDARNIDAYPNYVKKAYVDWNEDNQPNLEEAINKIISNFHNGEIMLLHSTSKTNSEIMGQIIDEARKQGYEFKSLDELK